MSELRLPLLKRHYCLICERWITNSWHQDGGELYIHDDKVHPENVNAFITNTEHWN